MRIQLNFNLSELVSKQNFPIEVLSFIQMINCNKIDIDK